MSFGCLEFFNSAAPGPLTTYHMYPKETMYVLTASSKVLNEFLYFHIGKDFLNRDPFLTWARTIYLIQASLEDEGGICFDDELSYPTLSKLDRFWSGLVSCPMLASSFRSLDSRLKYITKKTAPPAAAIKQTMTTMATDPLLIPVVSGGVITIVVVGVWLFGVVVEVVEVEDFVEAVVTSPFGVDFVGVGVEIWTEIGMLMNVHSILRKKWNFFHMLLPRFWKGSE